MEPAAACYGCWPENVAMQYEGERCTLLQGWCDVLASAGMAAQQTRHVKSMLI